MATIVCPKCKSSFDSSDTANRATPWAAAGALGLAGSAFGATVGLVTAGIGMAATAPLGVLGAALGYLGAKNLRRCPNCNHIFRI